MKKSGIRLGRYYARIDKRGKRVVRRVVDEGPQYKLYEGVQSDDCLQYEVVEGQTKATERYNVSTRVSFAAWAQTDVTHEFDQPAPRRSP